MIGDQLDPRSQGEDFLPRFIAATHEAAIASAAFAQNTEATQVLRAFNLEPLLDREFVNKLAMTASRAPQEVPALLQSIAGPWAAMTSCVDAIEHLTQPEDLRRTGRESSVLGITFAANEQETPTIPDVARVLALLQQVYSSVGTAIGRNVDRQLRVVNFDCSAPVQIDITGDPLVIEAMNSFIAVAWRKLRHRNIEELLQDDKDSLDSLPVMDKIKIAQRKQALRDELASQLRRKIVAGTLGLFIHGAVPIIVLMEKAESDTQRIRVPVQ